MLRPTARRRRFGGRLIAPRPHGAPAATSGPDASRPAPPGPARHAPTAVLPPTPHQQLQRAWGMILWSGILASVAVHWIAFAAWPTLTAPALAVAAGELEAVALPPEVEIPPPPEALARPAVPIASVAPLPEDITVAPTTLRWDVAMSLPPPPEEAAPERAIAAEPVFTPYTVPPRLLNRDAAAAAVSEAYPPILRDARIGGTVVVWFFIDAAGTVRNVRLSRTSGHHGFDTAALAVAPLLRFSPALYRDRAVPVWVQLPVQFEARR